MDHINISTWNVQGKGSPEEVDKILSRSSESKSEQKIPHIVCVQQANLPSSSGDLKSYRWLCSGNFGSAVLISKAFSLKSGTSEQICEQICVAEVITDLGTVIKIISCYIPPSTDYVTRDLWQKLTEVIKAFPCSVTYVLAGDFNAEIGKDDVFPFGIDRGVIGAKLYHKTSNENGIQLKKLALNSHSTIASTFGAPISDVPLYTYKNGEEKSQRSFIMVPTDRVSYPSRVLQQDCKLSWHVGYKCAVLSKNLKFTLYDKLEKLNSSEVIVSCWNVQGVSPSAVDKALSDFDLPVVCVQDIFLTSDNDVETKNYTWFTSKKLWGKNVGILIKTCPDISMADFEVVSEFICVGNVTLNKNTIKVICCCLPSHTDSERFQEVSMKLKDLVMNMPEEALFVVAGDFNTHVTYTILEDTLVFNEGDGNALFLQKFMKESNMEMPYIAKHSVTQVSEKVRRNSSFVLLSPSCFLKYSHKRYVRWVPFFENGVVTLYLPESDLEQDFMVTTRKSEKDQEKECGKVEIVDGLIYATKKFMKMKKYFSVNTTEQQAYSFIPPHLVSKLKSIEKFDLSDEIVAKYKSSPPPLEELLSILGDGFTLYYGFLQESALYKGCVSVLTASFDSLNRGALMAECIDVYEEKTETPVKRIVKFRWNGIVIHQQEGGKFISYKRIINKGQSVLISQLGQHYFTVKARESFYNDGLPPLCQDKDKLDEVLRVMKRKDFPPEATADDVKIFINEIFSGDPCFELVFGPDFSYERFLEPIKKYATSKNYGVRTFKSRKDLQRFDNLSVFTKQSPQDIRKKLLAIPEHQDLRFQLLPPCGTDKDYFEWSAQWTEKIIPDEYFKPYENIAETPDSTFPINGRTEEHISPADLEEIIKKQAKIKKRLVGFVHRYIRNVGPNLRHKMVKCSNLVTTNATLFLPKGKRDWIMKAREESDLPEDTVKKYCEMPPPIEELTKILGDEFTLYYGFGRESSTVSSTVEILAESFETTNRGGVMMEYIEVEQRNQPLKRLVKFKWNGICIHEVEASFETPFKNICQTGQSALVDKLGRHFHAVKAKMAYFNKGLPPLCQDKEKLNEIFREVKRSEFPETVKLEDVKKFISEFFRQDTNVELVFGPEFSFTELLEPIKKYAVDKELGYRLFKSTKDLENWDHLGVFIKRSPLEIRKGLMKLPDHHDLRFYLVPPCEFANKSHYDWIKYFSAESFIEEFKLLMEKEDETPMPAPAILEEPNRRTKLALNQITKPVLNQRTRPALNQRTRPALNHRTTSSLNQRTRPALNQRTRPALNQRTRPALNQRTRPALNQRTTPAMNQIARPAMNQRTTPALNRRTRAALNQRTTPALSQRTTPALSQRTTPTLRERTRDALSQRTTPALSQITRTAQNQRTRPALNQRTTPALLNQRTRPALNQRTRPAQNKRTIQISEARKRDRPQSDLRRENGRSQPARSVGRNQQVRERADYRRESPRSQPSRSARQEQQIWQHADYHGDSSLSQSFRPEEQNQQVWQQSDYRGEQSYSQPSRSGEQNQQVWQQPDDYHGEQSYSQPSRSDDYDIGNWFGYQEYKPETEGRKRDWQEMDRYEDNSYSQPSRADDYDISSWTQANYSEQERYMPERKRAREEPERAREPDNMRWEDVGPLVVVWPVTIRSEHESSPRKVLEANFPTEVSLQSNNRVAVYVTLPLRNRRDKKFCLCVGDGVYNATKTALDMIVKRSSVIKYSMSFLPNDGLVPDFIRFNIPCQRNPRTYVTLSWMDTGPLDQEKVVELFGNFKHSLNEDLFFDKNNYTHEMKLLILDLAPKHGLKVRHFGIDQKLVNRYVCVYKTRPKDEVLEEVLKMGDYHPKYCLVTNNF